MITDYLLEISYPQELEEIVLGRLFLTRTTGTASNREGVISAYFEQAAERDAAAAALRDLPVTLELTERERVDWLQRYQQSLKPLFIGRSFVVAPDESLFAGERKHRLVIPQEQAFGTGSHESTALCIELLEEIDLHGARGLDIGAGSGILALAMLRLGARKVTAFDIDMDALRPLRENRARNRVAPENMPLFIGGIEAVLGGDFDVVTMNILPEVIVPLMPIVKQRVRGALILSGILTTLRAEVLRACEGLRLLSEHEKGEWWAGRFAP
jgi:ribosomal protein L11 methyltransferase